MFKNAIFLYFRLVLVMGVNLYTSRIILNELGINDYGVYSVVGGIAVLFGFLNSAMSSSTQRFLSFEIGKGINGELRKVFNATVNIHMIIALIILILCETIGLWYLKNKVNLGGADFDSIFWLFQFSVFTTLITVIQMPYNALMISMEKMDAFAIFSFVEVIGKLLIAYSLVFIASNKLTVYGAELFILSIIIAFCYRIYCLKNFRDSRYLFYFDKEFYSKLLSYSGWNLFGNVAAVGKNQGINLVLNLFYGATLNASYAISMQVNGAVTLFMSNLQLAVSPRIVKSYASGKTEYLEKLVFQFSKYSFFLMSLIILPVYLNVDFILDLWLGIVPKYAKEFVSFTLVAILVDSFSGSLMSAVQATGKVKFYQMLIGTLIFLNLPLSYLGLKYFSSLGPEIVVYIPFFINVVILFLRLLFIRSLLKFNIRSYLKIVLLPSILLIGIFFIIYNLVIISKPFLLNVLLIEISLLSLIFLIGLKKEEQAFIFNLFQKLKNK